MTETVLLTGASGFIGSYLVRELAAAGHRVVGIDIKPPSPTAEWVQRPAADSFDFVLGNVEQWGPLLRAVERYRPTAMVHLAALVNLDILEREPFTALRVNVEASLNVFEAATIFGIRRVVYISSIGVLPSVRYRPIDANHPTITATEVASAAPFYGAAKLASEAFALAYHQSLDLDALIVRPSAVYGFGMRWPIHLRPMIEGAVHGEPVKFAAGADMLRDYTHAADVAQMVRRCVEIPGEKVVDRVFHCGTGRQPVTVGDAAAIIRDLVPGAQIEVGPGLAADEVRDAAIRADFDMSAARSQLGFSPKFDDLRTGLIDYIDELRRFEAAGRK